MDKFDFIRLMNIVLLICIAGFIVSALILIWFGGEIWLNLSLTFLLIGFFSFFLRDEV
jgi:hypothetical protein